MNVTYCHFRIILRSLDYFCLIKNLRIVTLKNAQTLYISIRGKLQLKQKEIARGYYIRYHADRKIGEK